MTIAERVRDAMNEQNWHKGELTSPSGTRLCWTGHVRNVLSGSPWGVFGIPSGTAEKQEFHAYFERAHKVVAAEHPEAVDGWLMSSAPLTWTGLCVWFNDGPSTWAEMETVVGKTAADGS